MSWALLGLVVSSVHAQVPGVLSQIGFVQVGGIPFHGEGRFKFAMVDGAPSPATLWSHDGSSLGGGEPGSWILTDLFHGRYSVSLGDTNVANMTAPIPASAVGATNVFLRIWFSDGVNGFEQLSPDQPLLSVPYALRAATVSEGAIGSAQLASNAVQGAAILDGTITGADLANGTLTTADFNLANVDVRYVLKAGDAMTGSLSVDGTIGFPTVSTPAMYLYASGTENAEKRVLIHSSAVPEMGLYFQDVGDRFIMKSAVGDSAPSLVVDLDNDWVAIGTATPKAGYALSVDGRVVCEELLVEDSGDWPDYVFEEQYRLQPLDEVEAHIKERKHLPGIPTAVEIARDGLPIGEMQKRMMAKIEELTLHLIDQHKRMATQEERIRHLESEVRRVGGREKATP